MTRDVNRPFPAQVESIARRLRMQPALAEQCALDRFGTFHAAYHGDRIGSSFRDVWQFRESDSDSRATINAVSPVDAASEMGPTLTGSRAYALSPNAGRPGNPLDSFDDTQLIEADRIVRAVHAMNFFAAEMSAATAGSAEAVNTAVVRKRLLFLPVHDRLLKSIRYDHGAHFAQVLIALGLDPGQVVIEIPPASSTHKTFAGYLLRSYRSHGFKVGYHLEDAGRVLSLDHVTTPDFVFIDSDEALRDAVVRPLTRLAAYSRLPVIFGGVHDADTKARLAAMGATYLEYATGFKG